MPFSESRPWDSVTCGCQPHEAKERTEWLRKTYGVTSAYYCPKTGNAKATDPAGRNAHIQASGGIDTQGGYGDYVGK